MNHTHRPMRGVTGTYCGACGAALPTPTPTTKPIPTSVLIELATALIAMRTGA